jgi:hypothetical protein
MSLKEREKVVEEEEAEVEMATRRLKPKTFLTDTRVRRSEREKARTTLEKRRESGRR